MSALSRQPSAGELQQWTNNLRASGQGQAGVLAAAQSLGRTLFTSSEYAMRGRSDYAEVKQRPLYVVQESVNLDLPTHAAEVGRQMKSVAYVPGAANVRET